MLLLGLLLCKAAALPASCRCNERPRLRAERLDYGTLCASWDAVDEDAWCDVGGPEACGTEATFRSGTDGEVYHYWSRAPCEKGAKPPPPLAEELVPDGPVGSVTECADPRNTYTFDHKPRCLAAACGNISWTKSCFDHLARQLKVVQRHEPPPCNAQKPRLIHMFWDGPLLRTVNIAIWGIIQTQSCSRLTVWHRKAFQDSAHKRLLDTGPVAEGKLVFRQFDEVALSRGTIFERWVDGYEAYTAKERAANTHSGEGYLPKVGFSDFVRFLVLYLFGGLYVDADVATLQDLWPLYGREFTYRCPCPRRDQCLAVMHRLRWHHCQRRLFLPLLDAQPCCRPRCCLLTFPRPSGLFSSPLFLVSLLFGAALQVGVSQRLQHCGAGPRSTTQQSGRKAVASSNG